MRILTTPDIEEIPQSYAAIVGERLRAIRRQRRLSLQAVAAASGQEFKASVLGAYERGERAISVPRLQRLAERYGVPVDQLLPGGAPQGALPDGQQRSRQDRIRIDLDRMKTTDGEIVASLRCFVNAIQVEREDFNAQLCTIRLDDLRVIGATLGLGVEEIVERIGDLGLIYER